MKYVFFLLRPKCMMLAWALMIWQEYVYKVRKRQERFTSCHIWWIFSRVPCSGHQSRSSWPIGGQYPGHVITLDQSEASFLVTWSLLTHQRPVSGLVIRVGAPVITPLSHSGWAGLHNVIMYHFLNYISTLMPSRDQPASQHTSQPALSDQVRKSWELFKET